MKTKWKKVAKAIDAIDIESGADGTFLSNDQLDKLETALPVDKTETEKKLTQAQADLATAVEANKVAVDNGKKLTADLATANEQVKTLTAEKATLQEANDKLTKKPAAKPTAQGKKADDDAAETEAEFGLSEEDKKYQAIHQFDFKTSNLTEE